MLWDKNVEINKGNMDNQWSYNKKAHIRRKRNFKRKRNCIFFWDWFQFGYDWEKGNGNGTDDPLMRIADRFKCSIPKSYGKWHCIVMNKKMIVWMFSVLYLWLHNSTEQKVYGEKQTCSEYIAKKLPTHFISWMQSKYHHNLGMFDEHCWNSFYYWKEYLSQRKRN